jgi:Integrase core domain
VVPRLGSTSLNLDPCFTPVESPESNGMAEAFVKTFKRDYVPTNPLPDARTALSRIDHWMEDCNSEHPHSRLGLSLTARVHCITSISRVSGLTGSIGVRRRYATDAPLPGLKGIHWCGFVAGVKRRDGRPFSGQL